MSSELARVAIEPLLLDLEQSAALLGISPRRFQELRSRLPPPIVLGPRSLRWSRSDLHEAVAHMPRQEKPAAEPLQLAKGRAARAGRTEVSA